MNRKVFHIRYLAVFAILISFSLVACKKEKPLEPYEEAGQRQTPDDSGEDDYYNGNGNIEYFQATDSSVHHSYTRDETLEIEE